MQLENFLIVYVFVPNSPVLEQLIHDVFFLVWLDIAHLLHFTFDYFRVHKS